MLWDSRGTVSNSRSRSSRVGASRDSDGDTVGCTSLCRNCFINSRGLLKSRRTDLLSVSDSNGRVAIRALAAEASNGNVDEVLLGAKARIVIILAGSSSTPFRGLDTVGHCRGVTLKIEQ